MWKKCALSGHRQGNGSDDFWPLVFHSLYVRVANGFGILVFRNHCSTGSLANMLRAIALHLYWSRSWVVSSGVPNGVLNGRSAVSVCAQHCFVLIAAVGATCVNLHIQDQYCDGVLQLFNFDVLINPQCILHVCVALLVSSVRFCTPNASVLTQFCFVMFFACCFASVRGDCAELLVSIIGFLYSERQCSDAILFRLRSSVGTTGVLNRCFGLLGSNVSFCATGAGVLMQSHFPLFVRYWFRMCSQLLRRVVGIVCVDLCSGRKCSDAIIFWF